MHDFPLEDVRKAIEGIGEDLNIPMDKVTVTRLDLAEDLGVTAVSNRIFQSDVRFTLF